MIRSVFAGILTCVTLALPASAATVFSTDFSGDTAALNTVPAGFSVTGKVDIVAPVNPYSITTTGTNVVDLDGSPGPGTLTSLNSYSFAAGDKVTLTFDLGGAQRGSSSDSVFAQLIFGVVTSVKNFSVFGSLGDTDFGDTLLASTFTANSFIAGTAPFAATGFMFTAVNAGSLGFAIGTSSNDNIGPLLNSITLDVSPAPVPLPAAGGALLLGLGLLAAARRRAA